MNDPAPLPEPAIELRAWRQFLALAETLHYGRAAERLHMTQPPLTQAIQQLERRLGVELFRRTRRSVALTPAGAALVAPVRLLLRQAAGLPATARAAGEGDVGQLRLGFVSTVGFGPLPGWLRGFRQAQPGIGVALQEATGDVQLRALGRGEADAGFLLHAPGMAPLTTEEGARPLQRLSLGSEAMVLALPEASPLAAARRIVIRDVLAEPLVIFPREIAPSLFDALLAHYHRHAVAPRIVQQAIQMQTIVNLVSAGLGVAWVPQAMTQLQRPGVAYRALPAAMQAPRAETSLVWLDDAAPAVLRFVEYVRASMGGTRGRGSAAVPAGVAR